MRLDFGRLVAVSAVLFVIGAAVGMGVTLGTGSTPAAATDGTTVEALLADRAPLSTLLVTNLGAMLLALVFPFSLVVLLFNGFNLGHLLGVGLVADRAVVMATLTLPHAVFEVAAMWLTGAVGLKIVVEVLRYLGGSQERVVSRRDLRRMLRLTAVAAALVIVGAFVERYLTPELVRLVA